jgi:ABC-type multidrug transport system permease subunit
MEDSVLEVRGVWIVGRLIVSLVVVITFVLIVAFLSDKIASNIAWWIDLMFFFLFLATLGEGPSLKIKIGEVS